MSAESGFVKLPRELFYTNKKSPFYGHLNLWGVFSAIVVKVRFGEEPSKFKSPWGEIELKPKEFLLNKKQISWESGLTRQTVIKCVKKLEKLGVISLQMVTPPGYTPKLHSQAALYTLTDKYYDLIFKEAVTPPGYTGRLHHKKKIREKENTKKERNTVPQASLETLIIPEVDVAKKIPRQTSKVKPQLIETPPSDVCLSVASEWLKMAEIQYPRWRGTKSFTLEAFAQELSTVQRKTNLTDSGLKRMFDLLKRDPFWIDKVLPSTLLKKTRDGLTKLDHILKKETRNLQANLSMQQTLLEFQNEKRDEIDSLSEWRG